MTREILVDGDRPVVRHSEVLKAPTARAVRVEVDLTEEMARAVRGMCSREGVSLNEALRRLVGYGDLVYRTDRSGGEVLIRYGDKQERVRLHNEPRGE